MTTMHSIKKSGVALLFVALQVAVVSCKPEVAALAWEPLDYPQTIDAMANPTGPLTNGSPEETLEMIAEELGLTFDNFQLIYEDYRAIHEELKDLLDLLEDSEGGQSLEDMEGTDFDEKSEGTSAYVRILCSGPVQASLSSDPDDPDYYGEIRVDDPNLNAQDAINGKYVPDGQLLVDFKDCESDDLAIVGQCPSFASDYYDNLLLEMDVTLYPNDRDSYRLRNDSLFSPKAISVLFEISGEGTYRVSLGVDGELSLILGTADGDFFCTVGGDNLFQCGIAE
jgi:hypothetical protein